MASVSTATSLPQLHSLLSHQSSIPVADKHQNLANTIEFRTRFQLDPGPLLRWHHGPRSKQVFSILASGDSGNDFTEANRSQSNKLALYSVKFVGSLRETAFAVSPVVFTITRKLGNNLGFGIFITITFLVIAVREILSRRARYSYQGSVADLVKRGQLRSDRRGISEPLKYDDPFNNPLVKINRGQSTVEMCGKVYRLAPVTLTKEQQSGHQKRRSHAYQWKRPTVFLKEGDPIPPAVDPDTIRWIPANHPFATTVNDIDEDLAQNNVYQKDGVPFRIKAEHEALQRKLEALQNEQKLNKVAINPASIREFGRPLKSFSKQYEQLEDSPPYYEGSSENAGPDLKKP